LILVIITYFLPAYLGKRLCFIIACSAGTNQRINSVNFLQKTRNRKKNPIISSDYDRKSYPMLSNFGKKLEFVGDLVYNIGVYAFLRFGKESLYEI